MAIGIDLFSGVGGLSLGAEMAGVLTVVDVHLLDRNSHRKVQRVGHDLILVHHHFLVAVYTALFIDVLRGLGTP